MLPLNSGRLSGTSVPPRREDIRARKCARSLRFSRIFCGTWRIATGLFLLAAIVLGAQSGPARTQTATETATYTVTFEGNWNTDSTPGGVVSSAHFTTLIGAVHNGDVAFWAAGEMATAGVERVAELGVTGTFETEISNAEEGTVKSLVKKSDTSATGTRTFEVEFSRTHPLLTLLSMIGPSPDWFVGVSGLSLLDGSDAWLPSHTADLFPYDAGTENGEEFSLSNPSTVPQGTITSLRGQGKFSDAPMARLSFTLNAVVPPPEEEMCAVSGVTDDQSLRRFVGCAAERIKASNTFDETVRLLDEFRDDEGNWNDGSTYLVLLTGRGGVYFHAEDREAEEMDWSGILFCEGGGSVLDTQEGCFIEYDGERHGYAHPFSASHVPMAHGGEFVLVGGFDETPGEVDTDGGGGCTLGGSDSGNAFGLFLTALALILTVLLKRHSVENNTRLGEEKKSSRHVWLSKLAV